MSAEMSCASGANNIPFPTAAIRPEDLLCTEDLYRRTPRTPRFQQENEAFRFLASCLAHQPKQILQVLADQALALCQGGSAGVSLLEEQPDGTTLFRWVALSGACASYIGGTTPRDWSPCGTCLDRNSPVLVSYPARCFTYFQSLPFPIVEGLVLPLAAGDQVFGTIWVMSHTEDRHFDAEDVRIMTGLADFTSAALRLNGLHEELQRSNAELRRSNEDLEHFAFLASHDLREPLRTVRVFTQLLARRYPDKLDNDAKTFIGYIEDSTERMDSLIRGLLTYANCTQSAPARDAVNLNEVVKSACRNCQELIQETGAEVTADTLSTVRGSAEQLLHVFQNLFSNAIRYRSTHSPRVHVRTRDDGSFIVVSVQDNGVGIAPEYQAEIFQMFKRLNREQGGSGLGLALCQRIVKRLGGTIWVESELGEGSTFSFTLPK